MVSEKQIREVKQELQDIKMRRALYEILVDAVYDEKSGILKRPIPTNSDEFVKTQLERIFKFLLQELKMHCPYCGEKVNITKDDKGVTHWHCQKCGAQGAM